MSQSGPWVRCGALGEAGKQECSRQRGRAWGRERTDTRWAAQTPNPLHPPGGSGLCTHLHLTFTLQGWEAETPWGYPGERVPGPRGALERMEAPLLTPFHKKTKVPRMAGRRTGRGTYSAPPLPRPCPMPRRVGSPTGQEQGRLVPRLPGRELCGDHLPRTFWNPGQEGVYGWERKSSLLHFLLMIPLPAREPPFLFLQQRCHTGRWLDLSYPGGFCQRVPEFVGKRALAEGQNHMHWIPASF